MKTSGALLALLFLLLSTAVSAQELPSHECDLELPAVMSINNGSDSIWFTCPCEIIAMHFSIYNRWGAEIYSSADIFSPFDIDVHARNDGKENTFRIAAGTYYYSATYSVLVGDIETEHKRQGTITIIH